MNAVKQMHVTFLFLLVLSYRLVLTYKILKVAARIVRGVRSHVVTHDDRMIFTHIKLVDLTFAKRILNYRLLWKCILNLLSVIRHLCPISVTVSVVNISNSLDLILSLRSRRLAESTSSSSSLLHFNLSLLHLVKACILVLTVYVYQLRLVAYLPLV